MYWPSKRADERLPDLVGETIALRFVEIAEDIPVDLEDGPSHRDAVRADLAILTDGQVSRPGTTLVFPDVLQRELLAHRDEWVGGVLSQEPQVNDPDRSVFLLTAPDSQSAGIMEEALG